MALLQHSKQQQHSSNLVSVNIASISTNILNKYNPLTSSSIILNVSTNMHQWILDIRAIDHICCQLEYFMMYKKVRHIYVRLPNGACVNAQYMGTIHFSLDFYLTDVLYMPKFTFNLILVTKVILVLNCQLIFHSEPYLT